MAKTETDSLVGTVVGGKFRVLALVARGGMGKIYRAEQIPLGRTVALKVLQSAHDEESSSGDENQFHQRFLQEASILSKLQHRHIVTLFDYGEITDGDKSRCYIAMELLKGESLQRRVRRDGPLSPETVLTISRQIARGLREAHKHRVVHRDLKPSNVVLVPEDDIEVVKLVDFGIGKVLRDDARITQEGVVLGSPRYMAPEQAKSGHVDARTDLYALGILMYECLAGEVPFAGETGVATLMAHCTDPVPPIRQKNRSVEVPIQLENLVRRMLEKDPSHRPASMAVFLEELSAVEDALFGTPRSMAILSIPSPPRSESESMSPAAPEPAPLSVPSATPQSVARPRPTLPSFPPTPARSRLPILFAGVLVVGTAIGLIWFRSARTEPPTAGAGTNASPSSTAVVAPTFTLTFESVPPGALVSENGASLGSTPLKLVIDRTQLRGTHRRFVLASDGFEPYPVEQGDSESDLSVRAVLKPAPSASAASARAKPVAPPHSPPPVRPSPAPTAPTPGPNRDNDINTRR